MLNCRILLTIFLKNAHYFFIILDKYISFGYSSATNYPKVGKIIFGVVGVISFGNFAHDNYKDFIMTYQSALEHVRNVKNKLGGTWNAIRV